MNEPVFLSKRWNTGIMIGKYARLPSKRWKTRTIIGKHTQDHKSCTWVLSPPVIFSSTGKPDATAQVIRYSCYGR